MNLAKVSINGQITVPVEIRRKLRVKDGDKLIFVENKDGEIIIKNSSIIAIKEAQKELKDVKIGEDEILNDIMELRYSKDGEK
ncbi:MAG: AbrB/MazE/SpoVT family DNA-binding domain-containing protein [Oscillospiraceae bacterium]|nr:AbrB/MazE/SpoVT family DNA-binding domain-containing protein [Oscillospiraceae bacterium]